MLLKYILFWWRIYTGITGFTILVTLLNLVYLQTYQINLHKHKILQLVYGPPNSLSANSGRKKALTEKRGEEARRRRKATVSPISDSCMGFITESFN